MREDLDETAPSDVDATGSNSRRSFAIYSCGCLAIAFGSLLLLAATIGIVWAYIPSVRWSFAAAMSDQHAFHARIYEEALASGEAALAYTRSDDRFKAAHTEEQLAA